MKPLSTDDLRQAYLDFFREKQHVVIPGAPLIPENDPTVLFTTAGMHPLVPYLLGGKHPKGERLVDCQRCVRTQDIDEVGDAWHLTFFEMLGNWSLGDYFKKEAIAWSFEFLTEVLRIPREKLGVSCFGGDNRFPEMSRDEETASIWKSLGIPEERIGFIKGGMLESKHNWWGPAGKSGPCGPDSEMFYWVGGSVLPPPGSNPATDEKNWMEVWNDVFMQYRKTETGMFEPLAQKNVDTGMGLERIAAVMQGVPSVYETDRMKPVVDAVMKLIVDENTQNEIARKDWRIGSCDKYARIITDHLRAATFIAADGVLPSNVDQGYVLRKLIRRAIRLARLLGIEYSGGFSPAIADIVIEQYGHIYGHLREKSRHIRETLATEERQFGRTLQEGLKHFERSATGLSGNVLDGLTAFHLYDTYGFPLELTKELAAERGLTVEEEGFRKAFEEHQQKSRAGAEKRFAGGLADHSAETTKLHTATHLLNAALRRVLGGHVYQKGSNITAERLRFDFSHPEKMKQEQLRKVEELVNEAIHTDLPVRYHVTSVEGAKREGAIGVFDERYATEVKVYVIGDEKEGTVFSKEICGGPHVARTGMIGKLTIQKEESAAAGVRRIRAVVEGGLERVEVAGEAR